MEMTMQEAIDLHQRKWLWIAEETKKQQRVVRSDEYFKSNDLPFPHILSYCCEYSKQCSVSGQRIICLHCPIQWPLTKKNVKAPHCPCMNSLYWQWSRTRSWEEAAELARKIAALQAKAKGKGGVV